MRDKTLMYTLLHELWVYYIMIVNIVANRYMYIYVYIYIYICIYTYVHI